MLCVHYLPFSFEQIFMIIQGQTENLCVGLIIILGFLQVKLIKKLMLTSWKRNAIPSGMMVLLHQLLFWWGVICMQQMLGIHVLQFQWLAKVNISLQNLANVHFSSGELTRSFLFHYVISLYLGFLCLCQVSFLIFLSHYVSRISFQNRSVRHIILKLEKIIPISITISFYNCFNHRPVFLTELQEIIEETFCITRLEKSIQSSMFALLLDSLYLYNCEIKAYLGCAWCCTWEI